MPYVNNQGINIYYEVEGDGPPLVLAHGGGQTLDDWRRLGYAEALKNDFKLVLFDARGHGRSDKPHEATAYGPVVMANDVIALLDSLGIRKAHFFGYSVGALTGFRLAPKFPERFSSFVLGGASPYFSDAEANSGKAILDGLKLLLTDPEAFFQRREQASGRSLTTEEKNALLANDAEARVAVVTANLNRAAVSNEVLADISVPCLLYCGELDPAHAGAQEAVNYIPHATFVSLPGFGHIPGMERSEVVLPYFKEFLAEVK